MTISSLVKITKANGTKAFPRDLKMGDEILGFDSKGNLSSHKIKAISAGQMKNSWWKVIGPRIKFSRGHSTYSCTLTEEHVFRTVSDGSVPIRVLSTSSELYGVASRLKLSLVQKSILLGILLGDGTIKTSPTQTSKAIKWNHSSKQKDYLDWSIAALGGLARQAEDHVSGYGSKTHSALTLFHPEIAEAFKGFEKPSGSIPEWVKEELNPIAIAYWYMDDGALSHHPSQRDRANFSTYSFNLESHLILQAGLAKLGILSTIQSSPKGNTIRVDAESADLLFCLIAPYIPPTMQYKLPEYYRGNSGWLPPTKVHFQEEVTSAPISKVEQLTTSGREFYVSTELGNYFANGLLVEDSLID